MKSDSSMVQFDNDGLFVIEDPDMLDSIAAGYLNFQTQVNVSSSSADHVCHSQVDTGCNKPTNNTCVAPDGVCGSNVGCDHASIGA